MSEPIARTRTHRWYRLLGFVGLTALTIGLSGPLTGIVFGLFGLAAGSGPWVFGLAMTVLMLLSTWLMVRTDGTSLRSLGLSNEPRRWREFFLSFLVGTVLFALIGLVQASAVGARWSIAGADGVRAALLGLPVALLLLLPEELIFRGYGFQQMERLMGSRAALVLSSAAFGAYHLIGSGDWAMGAVWRFATPALGGLVFGVAMLRTRGLAAPIGLHLGGNWVQQSVLGLGHPLHTPGLPASALWTAPLDATQMRVLVAPDLLPHLPYLVAIAMAAVFVVRFMRQANPDVV